jgi:ubiquinone/menaquinone biosynthesis C-methylase UbiE
VVQQHSDEDKIKILKFFNELHKEYGQHSARAIGWENKEIQHLRFEVLTDIGDLEGARILDVGSGLGDMYGFLESQLDKFEYVGIDITPGLLNDARNKYPDGDFRNMEVFEIDDNSFDYAFASGVFSYNIPDYLEKYFQIVEKMFGIAKKGVAFNMLNKAHHDIDDMFMAYDPDEIAELCKRFTDNVVLNKNYLPQDFTIYLNH